MEPQPSEGVASRDGDGDVSHQPNDPTAAVPEGDSSSLPSLTGSPIQEVSETTDDGTAQQQEATNSYEDYLGK